VRSLLIILTALIALGSRVAYAQETCGDLIDNDSDGLADEQCNPAAVTGVCESPVSCGTTGAVAPRTGQLVYNEPADIAPRVPFGPPLALSRNYASLAADQTGYRGSLGKGWRHSFMGWLELNTTPNPDQAIARLVSGQEVLFEYSGEDATSTYDLYTPQPGYHVDTLRRHQTTDVWELITLEGWTYEYDDSSCGGLRMLVRIEDPFGQGLSLAYDGSCYLQTVTDADGDRQLAFTYDGNNKLDKIDFKIASTTRVTVQYTVTSDKLEDVTVGSTLVRDYTWTGNKLDLIEDGGAKNVADFTYLNSTAGKVARIKTADGHLGYRYGDTSCDGGEGLYVYYNDTDETDLGCDSDSECGTDNYCGGEVTPGTGNTGVCFRARRCISISASHDDVVDSVASAPTCTTCVDTKSYLWDTSPGLDLVSTESADSTWTHYDRNVDGLVTRVIEGDDDSNPATIPTGARVTWFYYHSTFRGRLTEVRRMTELGPAQGGGSCDSGTNTTDCKRTLYSYQATSGNGAALTSVEEDGWTYVPDAMSGYARQQYAYTTTYDYDSNGRPEAIFGPRGSVYDDVTFTYWSSSDPLKDGMLHQTTRALGASTGLTNTLDEYDYWGNAKSVQDPNGNYTCRTFHADLDVMTVNRVAMNNQTSCATTNSADLITSTTYDTSRRVTRIEKSLGNCVYRAYDAWGRLLTVKERDDCLTASVANTMELTYNDDGLVIKTEYKDTSDTVTYRRETTYGRDRRLYEIVNPTQTSKKRTLAYLADGMLDSITGEDGVGKTQWTYDARNRADVEKRYLDGFTTDDWGITNCLQMDRIFDVSDENGKSLERTWDDMRRNVKQVTPDGGTSLFFYDAGGNRTKHVEGFNSADEKTHEFTYDAQNRILTENYGDAACFTNGGAEIQYTYDTPSGCPGGSCPCPTGTCVNSSGRLAFVKVKVACDDARSDDTFDQIIYFGYDDAGRTVKETIQDDGGRNVTQNYNWDENGNLVLVEAPSGIDMKWTYGSGSANVDTARNRMP
jgi:YD repeat-containing protein